MAQAALARGALCELFGLKPGLMASWITPTWPIRVKQAHSQRVRCQTVGEVVGCEIQPTMLIAFIAASVYGIMFHYTVLIAKVANLFARGYQMLRTVAKFSALSLEEHHLLWNSIASPGNLNLGKASHPCPLSSRTFDHSGCYTVVVTRSSAKLHHRQP